MKGRMICVWLLLMTACSNRTGIPNGIIAPDSMRSIMKDLIMADGYAEQYLLKDTTKPDKLKASQELLEGVFKLHKISQAEFKTSLAFYESRPDLNKTMFDSLAAYGNRHKGDVYNPKIVKPHPIAPAVPK